MMSLGISVDRLREEDSGEPTSVMAFMQQVLGVWQGAKFPKWEADMAPGRTSNADRMVAEEDGLRDEMLAKELGYVV